MTYSLIEKEETIYEQQIDELFNLTEFDIATSPKQGIGSGKQYEYRDQDGKLWTGNSEFLNKIAHGDRTGHHLDIYKNTPSPKTISGTGVTDPIDPIEINPNDAEKVDPNVLPVPAGGRTGSEVVAKEPKLKPIIPPYEPKPPIKQIGTGDHHSPKKQIGTGNATPKPITGPAGKQIDYDPLTGKKIGTGKPLKQIPYTSDHGLITGPAGKQIDYDPLTGKPAGEPPDKSNKLIGSDHSLTDRKQKLVTAQGKADDIIKRLTQQGQTAQAKINLRKQLAAIRYSFPNINVSALSPGEQKLIGSGHGLINEPVNKIGKTSYDPLLDKPTGGQTTSKLGTGIGPDHGLTDPEKPLSPRNQEAKILAQKDANSIIKQLQNPKTTVSQRKKLQIRLNQLKQLKMLRLNIPDTPSLTGTEIIDNPELRNAKALLKKAIPGTTKHNLLQQQVNALSGNAEDPNAELNKQQAKNASNAIQKAEQEEIVNRKANEKLRLQQAAEVEIERKRLENIEIQKQAKLKAAGLVDANGNPISTTTDTPVVDTKSDVKKQGSAIGQGVNTAPEVLVKTGDSIKTVANKAGFTGPNAVEDFKIAQAEMGGGKISQATGKTSGKLIDVVHADQKYMSADQFDKWKTNFQKIHGVGYGEYKNAKKVQNSPKFNKLKPAQKLAIDNIVNKGDGKPVQTSPSKPAIITDPARKIGWKMSHAARLRAAMIGSKNFMMSPKGDILTTVVVAAATAYGSGKWMRNIEIEQERYRIEDERLRKEFEGNPANKGETYQPNVLYMLSPMQYVGGAGNFAMFKDPDKKAWWNLGQKGGFAKWIGAAGTAEMLTHDESIIKTMPESTSENDADIIKSLANVKLGEVTDYPDPYDNSPPKKKFDKWVKNNIVTLIMPDGTMRRVNDWGLGDPGEDGSKPWFGKGGSVWQMGQGKHDRTGAEVFKASLQPGTMIQVIPQVDKNGKPIPLNQQTKQMSTTLINPQSEWSGEFKDIYHKVSNKVERGGRITIGGGEGPAGRRGGKQMYIPTKAELRPFLENHMEHLIPEDWYLGFKNPTEWDTLTDEQKELRNLGLLKRPTTPEGWIAQKGFEGLTSVRFDTYMHAGPDMTDQELVDWWKKYRTDNKIEKPDGGLLGGDTLDPFLDPVGTSTGLWDAGLDQKISHKRKDRPGDVIGSDVTSHQTAEIDKVVGKPGEKHQRSVFAGAGLSGLSNLQNITPASAGWPTKSAQFGTLMTDLGTRYGIEPKLLRALSAKESGSSAKGGWVQGKYKGDTDRGFRGAWGLFHVRKGEDGKKHIRTGRVKIKDPAGVDEYNKRNRTNYQWKDVANDPYLAANIGAELFSNYYNKRIKAGMDPEKAAYEAYAEYNGGAKWRSKKADVQADVKERAKLFVAIFKGLSESKIYIQKSAILEGIAKAA
jgi:hypothetical protein